MYRIPLRVSGVDLDDEVTLELLGEHLSDLTWSEFAGGVVATLYTASKNPVASAIEAARRITHAIAGASVLSVDQELVTASDVAQRLGVSREGVRLWVEGERGPGGFPAPIGCVGNGRSKVWQWASVHEWVHRNYKIGGEERHLSPAQAAELNAALLHVKHHIDNEWETISSYKRHVAPPKTYADNVHDLLLFATEDVLTRRAKGHMEWAIDMGGNWSSMIAKYGQFQVRTKIEPASESIRIEELT